MRREELYPVERPERRPRSCAARAEALALRPPDAGDAARARLIVFVLSTLSFNFNVLLPVLAAQTLAADAGVFGIVTAVFGAGALVGALPRRRWAAASWKVLDRAPPPGSARAARARARAQRRCSPLSSSSPAACFTLWTSDANATMQLVDAGSAAGPHDRALLLRLQRHRPGRGRARRLARGPRRNRAGVRRVRVRARLRWAWRQRCSEAATPAASRPRPSRACGGAELPRHVGEGSAPHSRPVSRGTSTRA